MVKQQEHLVGKPPAVREPPAAEQYERYVGGTPERERAIFDKLARDLMRVQLKIKERGGATAIDRTFHAKAILGVENARLRFHDSLPEDLRTGFAQPGAEYPVIVRLSNASGACQPDFVPDLRGAALRVQVGTDEVHDLLMTNHPVSHARNAREFVVFAQAMAGATADLQKAVALYVRLPWALGWSTATRMRRNVLAGTRREVRSLALETYWSRGAILWGEAGPVRYRLRPAWGSPAAPAPPRGDADYLSHELAARLAREDVGFELCVQRYEDARLTPIEDGAAEWPDADVPVVPVATLTIPRQDLDTADARATAIRIDQLAFDPWNTTEEFRPLGNLNRARKAAYEAGSAHRRGRRFVTPTPKRNLVVGALLRGGFRALNRYVPWHRLPTWLGLRLRVSDGADLQAAAGVQGSAGDRQDRPAHLGGGVAGEGARGSGHVSAFSAPRRRPTQGRRRGRSPGSGGSSPGGRPAPRPAGAGPTVAGPTRR